jgi:hypothetical protein
MFIKSGAKMILHFARNLSGHGHRLILAVSARGDLPSALTSCKEVSSYHQERITSGNNRKIAEL